MVPCVSQMVTKIKYFPMNQNLTCANFGIYVATCSTWYQQYECQTFSTGWSSHRRYWNKPDTMDNYDQMVLPRNYSVFCDIMNKPHIYRTSTGTFIETPSFHTVDTCEVKWFDERDAHINIQSMNLPRVKQLLYYSICDAQWFSYTGLPTCFDFFYHSRSNRYWHFHFKCLNIEL